MKFSTATLLAVATQAFAVVSAQDQDDAIIGGTQVRAGDYPFLSSMQIVVPAGVNYPYKTFHFCGGSLIGPQTILTAAHCVTGEDIPETFQILIGSTDLDGNNAGKLYYPDRIIPHEDYLGSQRDITNDIAIIKLTVPVANADDIMIEFDQSTDSVDSGVAIIAGWGKTVGNDDDSSPRQMREANVPLVNRNTCRNQNNVFQDNLTDKMVCIGFANGSKGSCQGDSGGPLFKNNMLYGITSWGVSDCASYAAYTRVNSYTQWIKSKMSQWEGGNNPGPGPVEPPKVGCKCLGANSNANVDKGKTCGRHGVGSFDWCYTTDTCTGSKPSSRFPDYNYVPCTQSFADKVVAFNTLSAGVVMSVGAEEDFSGFVVNADDDKQTKTEQKEETQMSAFVVGLIGAGIMGVASAGAFVVYKKRTDAYVNEVINRAENERGIESFKV